MTLEGGGWMLHHMRYDFVGIEYFHRPGTPSPSLSSSGKRSATRGSITMSRPEIVDSFYVA